jgi:hypothetical protein
MITQPIRTWLHKLLGIDKMRKELDDLRQENEQLKSLFNDHDKAIAYIAVVHARAFSEIMASFRALTTPQGKRFSAQKKSDDDLIN